MPRRTDKAGTSDVLEVLVSLMIVSAGVMLLAASLPAMFSSPEGEGSELDMIIADLAPGGTLELLEAEQKADSMSDRIGVRLIFEDEELTLRPGAAASGERYVARLPVTVMTADGQRPAVLEVSCSD